MMDDITRAFCQEVLSDNEQLSKQAQLFEELARTMFEIARLEGRPFDCVFPEPGMNGRQVFEECAAPLQAQFDRAKTRHGNLSAVEH